MIGETTFHTCTDVFVIYSCALCPYINILTLIYHACFKIRIIIRGDIVNIVISLLTYNVIFIGPAHSADEIAVKSE